MSMINDALRRASSAAKSGTATDAPLAPPPPPLPPMAQAVPPPPPPPMPGVVPPLPSPFSQHDGSLPAPPPLRVAPTRKKSVLPIILIVVFLFGLSGSAGVYLWQKSRLTVSAVEKSNEEPTDAEFAAALLGNEKARPKIVGAADYTNPPVPVAAPPRPVAKPVPVLATAIPSPAPAPAAAPVAPAVPAKFPPLRLQSIFYRPSNPSVIINGKTLFVTDEINGVTVADIRVSSVTLVLSGQTNTLTLR